jgi:transposase
MMGFYLQELSGHLAGCRCILAMDQAGWRLSRNLDVPKGIKIVHIPAHTPELNPVERLWHVLKRRALRNRFLRNIEEVEVSVMRHCQEMGPMEMARLHKVSCLPPPVA